jgi:hypothetical protein
MQDKAIAAIGEWQLEENKIGLILKQKVNS